MKVFDGLGQNQAVKVGDRYIVCLYGSYKVNGEKVQAYNQQVLVDDLKNIVGRVPPKQVVVGYASEDGEEISVEEFNRFSSELYQYWDEDLDQYSFPDVDTEIEHVKKRARYTKFKSITEDVDEEIHPVEITVVGSAEDTGSRFIETPFQYGKVSHGPSGGIYKVYSGRIARDEVMRLSKANPDVQVDVPSHGNIEFVKVGGGYVFTKSTREHTWIKDGSSARVFSSLEEARQHEEEIRSYVSSLMKMHMFPKKADGKTIQDLVSSLRLLEDKVMTLDVKQKSVGQYRILLKMLQDKIDELVEENND